MKARTALSLIFILVLILAALTSEMLLPFSFEEQNIADRLAQPSNIHWMGTDQLGRDLFSRILYGARMSLAVGLLTSLLALIVGTISGAIAGYKGGWTDHILMRIADLFYLFPSTLMAILIMLLLGRGFFGVLLALSFSTWVIQARLARNLVLQIKELPYVEAARALGLNDSKILWKHLLPGLIGPSIVMLTFQIPNNIMAESFLSFIGLGLQPPASSWGTLAAEGFRGMQSYPHLILYPGLILFLTLLAFTQLGEYLRQRLDPKRDHSIKFS